MKCPCIGALRDGGALPFELNGTGSVSSHFPSVFLSLFYLAFVQCVLYVAINQDSLSCSPCHVACHIILNLKSYRGEEVH